MTTSCAPKHLVFVLDNIVDWQPLGADCRR